MSEQYTPDEDEVRDLYVNHCDPAAVRDDDFTAEFDRFLARVRRNAALHEKQRIAGEVRLWASVNDGLNEPEQAASLRSVAYDIDRIPEESP